MRDSRARIHHNERIAVALTRMLKVTSTSLMLAVFVLVLSSQANVVCQQSDSRVVYQGIAVDLRVKPLTEEKRNKDELREGDDALFQLRFSESSSGVPVTGVYPKAWMDLRGTDETVDCKVKVKAFLSSNFQARAPVDLNSYYILALNQDATLSVIDPLFSYGGSKLFTLVGLKSAGADWVLSVNNKTLFVSMPASHAVAAVNTDTWKVTTNIEVEGRPVRISVQPDGRKIWVGYEPSENGGVSGVAVIEAEDLKHVVHIPTGRGHHEIAFSDNSRFAFVTNSLDGNVSIIDIHTLKKIRDIATGSEPVSIEFSPKAKMAYVADKKDGTIVAIDGSGAKIAAKIHGEAGLKQIKFAGGDGRFAFVTNPEKDLVYVIDSASNRIIQTADIDNGPDQVSFSAKLAYVRSLRSEIVSMLPLPQSDTVGKTVAVVDFPGGQHPVGETTNPSPADSIVKAPGEDAVLVGNPMDKTIYYYQEGMAAPQGNFSNYGREPRAVLVVDRSFNERSPGVYEVTARMPRAGLYDFALVTDAPRIVHCFPIRVAPNPNALTEAGGVRVEPLVDKRVVEVGENIRLRFKLIDVKTNKSKVGLVDVGALIFSPGQSQQRHPAREVEKGIYEVSFQLSQSGVYYVYLGSPSAGLKFDSPQSLVLQAKDKESP